LVVVVDVEERLRVDTDKSEHAEVAEELLGR
jgi:hypothetical protein